MGLVARVVRQFHDGAEAVSLLERTVALPFQLTMGTKLVILTDQGVTPRARGDRTDDAGRPGWGPA